MEKIKLLNETIKNKLGVHYIGQYIDVNTPVEHLEGLFELHNIK